MALKFKSLTTILLACAAVLSVSPLRTDPGHAQEPANTPHVQPATPQLTTSGSEETPGELHGKLLEVPITRIIPGAVTVRPDVKSPVQNQSEAAARGMQYFNAFNCVGCHAANGGGGMGPSLSNGIFKFGSDPANIYLTIVQGRALGMPAWGTILPDGIIWDLVAYVQSISQEPAAAWGRTLSSESPKVEQVPAEFQVTPSPWQYTQGFSSGQKPK